LSGSLYINVHTAANPNGEIRGQILLETDDSYISNLNGVQLVPMITSPAIGLGTFKISKSGKRANFHIVADSLSGAITSAHLHTGAPGTNGGVAIDLSTFISGNVISGEFDPTAILTDLKAGNIYLNLHTAANPNGEVRGQLNRKNNFTFDSKINGSQQVPAVTTIAAGVADINLNFTRDTLWFDILTNQISDTIHGAHLHNAAVGANGAALLDLTPFIMGHKIKGMVTGTAITQMLIDEMLEGNVYINLHTTLNPNGEIRGQVLRYAREGYSININGSQLVPATNSTALGSGIVSIDREQQEAHYMTVIDGTTATDVHFHQGLPGISGGVLYDLSSNFINNGAFGYWTKADPTTPFNTAQSLRFRKDSVYINFHNTAFPNGEIRGQVNRGYNCYASPPLAVSNIQENNLVSIFPNPTCSFFQISAIEAIEYTITDIIGHVIKMGNINAGENTIDVAALQTGIYFIKLKTNSNKTHTTKLIKN
jgi:hypothetical protein